MANLRLRNVQAFVDRHGHARYYYKGGKVVDRVLIDRDGKVAVIAQSAELGSAPITATSGTN